MSRKQRDILSVKENDYYIQPPTPVEGEISPTANISSLVTAHHHHRHHLLSHREAAKPKLTVLTSSVNNVSGVANPSTVVASRHDCFLLPLHQRHYLLNVSSIEAITGPTLTLPENVIDVSAVVIIISATETHSKDNNK